jgi:CheY-like chemotaxis protein
VCHLLKKTKVKIDSAISGEEAIELADKKAYDVILLDQRMPGMDGTETLQKIRALGSRLNCDNPIICLTADAIRGAKERYISQGFTDYLTKPVEGAALEKMLAEYLPREKVNFDISAEKASEDNGADFMDDPMLAELSKEGFDMKTAMKFFGNDKAFYERILRDFVSEYKDRSGKLTAFCDNKD